MLRRSLILAGGVIAALVLLSPVLAPAQSGGFGKNKVQYRAFDWHYISTEHFDIYFYEGGYDLAAFAADVLEEAYVKVSEQLNYRLRARVPVILYESHNDFQQTNVTGSLLEEGVGGFTESLKNRMVMPFTGSYEDFRHVLHHELTHAVTFEKLYGPGMGSLLSSRSLFQLPLWFAEGFAEYSSRYGWDTFADMVIRDATVHGYLIPLQYVGGYLAYKQGQSALLFLAERYGEEKIAEIMSRGRFEASMDNSFKKAIGLGVKEFDKAWQKRLRKEYWPEISEREEPKDFARQLTDHEKDGTYLNDRPAFSPRGDRIAILSEHSDYTEVKIISTVDGQKLSRVLKGGRSDRFESLHSFLSGISFSPDGSTLALIAKSRGEDALFLVDVDGNGMDKVLRLGFASMRSPVFAPDGQSVVFTAARYDRSDLYQVDIAAGTVRRLTDDHYDEQDVDFDPTGTKLVFASDRPLEGPATLRLPDEQNPRTFSYGIYNIFEANLTTGAVRPLTRDSVACTMPTYSPDGRTVCFVSNKNGIYNLYLLDSTRAEPYPITDAISGCFAPSWSPDGKSIAFTAFFRGGFDVFLMTEIRPCVADGEALELTAFMRKTTRPDSSVLVTAGQVLLEERSHRIFDEDLEFTSYVRKADSPLEHHPLGVVDTVAAADSTAAADSVAAAPVTETRAGDTLETAQPTPFVFQFPDTPAADSTTLAVTPVSDTTPFEVHKYKRKFSPDLVTGGLGYDTFYGLQGQSFFVISDFLGDHQFFIVTDLVNTIDQSNIQLYYAYRPRRIDLGIGLFHSKYYYIDYDDRLFSDRTYGLVGNASRPFSKFTRLQFDGFLIFIDRNFSETNAEGIFEDRFARVGLGSLSLVHDDISWGLTGPVTGRRYRLSAEYAPGGLSEGISYQAAALDFRQYFRFGRRYSLGLRVGGGVSGGKSAKRFYLGGVENWIGSKIGDRDVYDVEGLYFSQVITPLRGFNYYDVVGNKYFIANAEFRFPFIEHLALRFPLPIVLSQVAGALFFDMGSAWQGDEFQGATTADGFRLKDLKAAFGYGVRANLGFVVLRFDQAWRTDLRNVLGHPRAYFSLGADF